jgi:uncharacterized protein (TIGR02246 family)
MQTEASVRDLYLTILSGWNNRDAKAMAACFSDEGTLIGFDGSLVEGHAAILSHLEPIFADHPTGRFIEIVRSVRDLGGVALLRADAGIVPAAATQIKPELNARQTLVARQTGGRWLAELFQNTPAAPAHGSRCRPGAHGPAQRDLFEPVAEVDAADVRVGQDFVRRAFE